MAKSTNFFDTEETPKVDKGFAADNKYIDVGQDFGRPTLTKAGKTFDIYDWIQENREDTEIYPTLEKYGSLKRMELDTPAVYDDFTAIKDLRGIYDQTEAAQNMWDNLPIDVRKEFNNDVKKFMETGEEYLKQRIIKESEPKKEEPKKEEVI